MYTEAKDYLMCDESSPSGLVWKVSIRCGKGRNVVLCDIGDPAGHLSRGYWVVSLNGKKLQAHRVVYELLKGAIPEGEFIDHIDGNRSNNNINNLRAVLRSGNARNAAKRVDNSSGTTGALFKRINNRTYAVAEWSDPHTYNRKVQYFSVAKLGLLPAFSAACSYRREIVDKLRSKGAGYTPRHGE